MPVSGHSAVPQDEVVAATRRRWSEAERRTILAEADQSWVRVLEVARRHGLSPSLLFLWRGSRGLRKGVMASNALHGDDTPVPVLAPASGKTRTGRLWTYVRDERPHGGERPAAAVFFYSPDRKGERPRDRLKNFRGVLHADGYAGFNAR